MSTVSQPAVRPHSTDEPADRLTHILGDQATVEYADMETVVEPHSEDACARALVVCCANGWSTSVSGNGGWLSPPPPTTVRISTRRMRAVLDVRPADLYASVQAGVSDDDLANELATQGMWLPFDPPGTKRTVGAVLGCASQGALRTGFGGVRDHVLGLTVVTGSGRILRLGGRVVKNVAGFDLAKLVIGGFGAYGVVTSAHVKLRAVPARDTTWQLKGERARLMNAATHILAAGMTPAALQLSSDKSGHILTARMVGSSEMVAADVAGVHEACGHAWEELSPESAGAWWRDRRSAPVSESVTVRIGTTVTGVSRALEITGELPGSTESTFGFGGATVRWSGQADADDLLRMRRMTARDDMPLVVERASAEVLTSVGHYGVLPDASARLAHSLQRVFDPAGILSGALWGT